MKKYYTSIVEYLTKTIEVEAATKEEAKLRLIRHTVAIL